MDALSLSFDALRGQNYPEAYYYASLAVQENYYRYVAHLAKGLSAALCSTLKTVRAEEMYNEYRIAFDIVLERYSNQLIPHEDANTLITLEMRSVDYAMIFSTEVMKHRVQFRNLQSVHEDYWNICYELLDVCERLFKLITPEIARQARSELRDLKSHADNHLGTIVKNANESVTIVDGLKEQHDWFFGGRELVNNCVTLSPPYRFRVPTAYLAKLLRSI